MSIPRSRLLAIVSALALLAGCEKPSPTAPNAGSASEASGAAAAGASAAKPAAAKDLLFADVTQERGIRFVHDAGPDKNKYFMPRIVGSGAAFFDFDGDGRLDLFLLQNGGENAKSASQLYRQTEAGAFEDVSQGSGLAIKGIGMGVAAGDVNNDGQVDLVVTEYGRSRLFLNQSQGKRAKFADVSQAAGIDNPFWGTSAAMVDYDRDGWLDLVLVSYVDYDPSRWCGDASGRHDFCGPDNFAGRPTKLYRNLGAAASPGDPAARFEDVTESSGLASHPGPGLGVFCADFNGDRWVDIFIANDGKPNHLWINQKDGTFKEEGLLSGIATNAMGKAEANMGIAIGDVDGDGLFDLFVTHLTSETHTLWSQGPRGFFQDRTVASGVTTAWRATGFGTVMGDFDNDAHVDLSLVNGRVLRGVKPARITPGLDPFWHVYAERNQLLLNDGKGRLRDVSPANDPFSGEGGVSRGLACADFDDDGGLDMLVTRVAAPASLYRNVAARRGHWLSVRAVEPRLKRDAYGAEVYLTAGKVRRMQWINPCYSYLCGNDPRAHFGLGAAERYDGLRVVWPDGTEEEFPGGPADRTVVLRHGEGRRKGS